MIFLLKISISLLPVMIFLLVLILMDSYKLLKPIVVVLTVFYGICAAAGAFLFQWNLMVPEEGLMLLWGPLSEEFLKALLPVMLFKKKRIGFIVDSAIIGFASGAGFALLENILYLYSIQSTNLLLWIVRGLGTAVMHGGTIAILMIFSAYISERFKSQKILIFLPGFLIAVFIHSAFNKVLTSQLFPSEYITAAQLIILPLLISIAFTQSEKSLRDWMEQGLESSVRLLNAIRKGKFSETKAGRYVYSLREHFPVEVVADIFCYLQIYLDLSARAKANLMLREQGFPVQPDPDVENRFAELKQLTKNIGKTGQRAMAPVLQFSPRDLWQLYYLEKKNINRKER
ncbi:MAG: PrsW family intramembrane metalloprotease [Candidatus Marinimicrobia bacterium]|nr:PrsW family intramembrane metalloprotease [Candidatus Neomarinimicrobiota bacterium]